MPGSARVVVYDSRMQAWFEPGGMGYDYIQRKTEQVVEEAKARAPRRTGYMASRIRRDMRPRAGMHVIGEARSPAHYSTYVHGGTPPQVGFRFLDGTPGPGSQGAWRVGAMSPWPAYARKGVRGQEANPFLSDALAAVMGGGVLPGWGTRLGG